MNNTFLPFLHITLAFSNLTVLKESIYNCPTASAISMPRSCVCAMVLFSFLMFLLPRSATSYENVLDLVNETRMLQTPARRYCDGQPSLPVRNLYIPAACSVANAQTPLLNRTVPQRAYVIANLSFCCKSNYTAVLPAGTNITAKDMEARWLYNEALKGIISRFDCESLYPFGSCTHCLYAFRSWICAVTFPMACLTDSGNYEALRLCDLVCWEVMRKCPINMGFDCPENYNTADAMYTTPQAIDPFKIVGDITAGAAGCNPMEYSVASQVTGFNNRSTSAAGRNAFGGGGATLITFTLAALSLLI